MTLSYKKINANMHTALSVYKNLQAKCLLESATLQNVKGRYSLIIADSNFSLYKKSNSYFLKIDSKTYNLANERDLLPAYLKHFKEAKLDKLDFLTLANALKECYPSIPKELESIPMPLGGLGFLGYEFFRECEDISFTKPSLNEKMGGEEIPECLLIYPKECVIFDHFYDEAYVIVCSFENSNNLLESMIEKIENSTHIETAKSIDNSDIESSVIYEDSKEWYEKHVEIIKDEIYKGTFLQCVLSRAVVIESNINPLFVYETLRRKNPSPYMYYLDFDEFCIVGASPELMLKSSKGVQTLRPIAGTRKRGASIEEDNALEKDLLADSKENAEHLMLIDLARNDIGKNAKIGSVKLDNYKVVEKYASVMHIVSQVSGEIDSNKSVKDCLLSCFPAGTVSGAPKIEAIKRLNEYETYKRGVYAGAIVYFDRYGDLDSAITLRSTLYQNGKYYLQAGAGIVIDSNPRLEYDETSNKMKALKDILLESR